MDLIEQLLEPEISVQLQEVSALILPILLLFFALASSGLFYLSQVVFDGLEDKGDKIDELITAHGKLLLDLLVGSLLVILFSKTSLFLLASLSFWLFSVKFTIDILRLVAIRGYLRTIHSKGLLIPKEYNETKKFLRKLRNAGFMIWFMLGLLYFFTVAYPLTVSCWAEGVRCQLSKQSLVIFLLSSTTFSIFLVYSLTLEAVKVRGILRNKTSK